MLRIRNRCISPSPFCLKLSASFVTLLLGAVIFLGLLEQTTVIYYLNRLSMPALLGFIFLLIADGAKVVREPEVVVARSNARSVSVNQWINVALSIRHSFDTPRTLTIFDGLSQLSIYEALPAQVRLMPARHTSVVYRMKVTSRGPYSFTRCHVSLLSRLRLWDCQYRAADESSMKVFPDFSAVAALTLLAADNHENHIGIKRKPRRGEGTEFLQLRDYRSGDSLRQMDWKATSRRNQLISREYQDERDQHIVLLIDGSRRMRSKDDALNHFDHSLNASLLLSYLALRQGDSVSLMSFGQSTRWIASQKGPGAMKTILHGVYDLHPHKCAPDYVSAAEKLATLQRKRALVVLVTNLRDEDLEELMIAANLIQRRHLLLLASIRESVVGQAESQVINTLDHALGYAGLHQYALRRQQGLQVLKSRGIYAIDCDAKDLSVSVANSYFEIKRSGVL